LNRQLSEYKYGRLGNPEFPMEINPEKQEKSLSAKTKAGSLGRKISERR
jgi:hypothetical protein